MNKDKLILKDGSTIELEAGASLTALQVICQSADDVILLWKRLTQENLQEVTVKNGADLIVGVYSEMVLIEPHIQATEQEDGFSSVYGRKLPKRSVWMPWKRDRRHRMGPSKILEKRQVTLQSRWKE